MKTRIVIIILVVFIAMCISLWVMELNKESEKAKSKNSSGEAVSKNEPKSDKEREKWIQSEVEKLQYGSYLSTELRKEIQSNLRASDENKDYYSIWFDKGEWQKGYYITVDRNNKVLKIDTQLK